MELAPTAALDPASSMSGAGPIPGWTPDEITPVTSRFGESLPKSILGTWRGQRELADGQALSAAQVAAFAPFLAHAYGQPQAAVTDALEAVRLYVGGPVKAFGMGAVVLSNRIYVRDEQTLGRILGWSGRRFLAHELGHVMQRARGADDALARALGGGSTGADRAALARYVAGLGGAAARATLTWLDQRLPGRDPAARQGWTDLAHDLHRMEAEAERHAVAFRDATGR